ncbi:hypothetical protein Tco_1015231 [Tanacetum coccineum]|uniref:Phosphoprotein n=1 Tax=Tanacetum coccineum TaxID=301880 RepID=A0ABQ5FKC3_9ASTR
MKNLRMLAETHHQSPPSQADKPQSSHAPSTEASDTDSSCDDILKKYDNILPLTERQLVKDQTDKFVEASMSSLDKSSNTINDLYKGLNIITELLQEINNAVKDDSAYALKQDKELAAWAKSSTNMAWNIGSRLSGLERAQNHIQYSMSSPKEDPHSINPIMTEMYEVFKGQSLGSVTPTLALTHILANEKGIENESEEDPLKKLVPASTIVLPDPDEEIKVPYMINGKINQSGAKRGLIRWTDPKKIASAKTSEKFKKAQDAEHQVLKREHTEKVRKSLELEPEYGIFFTNEFGDQAFKRWSDIDKVGIEALVSYLVAASMVQLPKNARFRIKLKKLIAEHLDQEKLKPKKVKLEALGYEMN